jgi:hypothetical protein
MEVPDTQNPQQNIIIVDTQTEETGPFKVRFNSVFDSGNLRQVEQVTGTSFILQTAPDCCGTEFEGFTRSWFNFGVTGVPTGIRLTFMIKRIHILFSLYKSAPDAYKPVYKIGSGRWNRLDEKATMIHDPNEKSLDVEFSYNFEQGPEEEIFFAFSFPFSYKESQDMLEDLESKYKDHPEIYFHRDLMIQSPQDRNVDLVTISSHDGKLTTNESYINDYMFPTREVAPRANRYRANKPVILLTARVHPGEVPASHTMNGIINFLLDKTDARAHLLRKYFVFMLVPMINPDGVALGHYRMDVFHQNLNRHYKNPDPKKHSMIYGIKELVEYLHSENRLFFYCDLHAHAAKKGSFLYGNSLDYVKQVETILFAKVMSLNCINFEFESCNFSKKQMNSKDRGETLTKEGAGRVCVYKTSNIIHSYTLECGFHFSNELSQVAPPSVNKYLPPGMSCNETEVTNIASDMYKESPVYYTSEIYEDVGKAMLVSILDIFQKNPCTRILNTPYKNIEALRRQVATKISKYNRFKKDAMNVKKKFNKINELANELLFGDFQKRNVFFDEFQKKTIFDCGSKPPMPTVPKKQVSENKLFLKSYNDSPHQGTRPPRRTYTKAATLSIKESLTLESSAEQDDDGDESSEERSLPKLATKLQHKGKTVSYPLKEGGPLFETVGQSYQGLQKLTEPKAFFDTYKDAREARESGTPTRKYATGRFESLPTTNELLRTNEFTKFDDKNMMGLLTKSKMFKPVNMGSLEPLLPYKKYNILKIERKNYFTVPVEREKKPTNIKLPDLRNAVNEATHSTLGLIVGGKTMSNKIMRKVDLTSSRRIGEITED